MVRARKPTRETTVAGEILEARESTVLDLLDNLLNKGVMVDGDVTLGLAGIDLIYLRLSSILCAADRVLPEARGASRAHRARRRRPPTLKRRA